jgi:hypothetical protein
MYSGEEKIDFSKDKHRLNKILSYQSQETIGKASESTKLSNIKNI